MIGENYSIDPDNKTVTYWTDTDTDQRETVAIGDLLELLFWLKSRELELRQIVHKHTYLPIRKTMTLINGFYVGIAEDRQKVKVKASRYMEVWKQAETSTRQNWLQKQIDRQELEAQTGGIKLVQYRPGDNTGKVVDHNPVNRETWTLADCPDYLINQEQDKLKTPEYWLVYRSGDNLAYGQYIKLP